MEKYNILSHIREINVLVAMTFWDEPGVRLATLEGIFVKIEVRKSETPCDRQPT